MADIQDVGPGVDVTRGVRVGVDIRESKERIRKGRSQEKRDQQIFELNKRAAEQNLEIQARQEKERQKTRQIDKLERRYEIAVKQKNFEAADRIRFEWGQASGIHIGGDHEEIANLLTDRRQAVNSGDKETVAAVDDYLSQVRRITPEAAAELVGFTAEAEEFAAERKFGRKIKEEEQVFGIGEERRKKDQAEVEEATAKAVEGIEGLDETTKALLPLISSKRVSGAVLNQLAAQSGVTFRQGLEGAGVNEGKAVTAVFDKAGKKIAEFPEAPSPGVSDVKRFTEINLFGEQITKFYTVGEDANGNPVVRIVPIEPEAKEGEPKETDRVENLKTKLAELGSTDVLTPEAFLELIDNLDEITDEQIAEAYKKALEAQSKAKASKGLKESRKPTGLLKGLLRRGKKGIGFPAVFTEKDEGEDIL